MLASGMGEGHNERALREIESGAAQLVLAAPGALRLGRVPGGARAAAGGAVRRRRGALRGRVGARLPARLPAPAARRSTSLGRPPVMAATATATPRGRAGDRGSGWGCATGCRSARGFDRPNLTLRGGERRGQGRAGTQARRADARAGASAGRRARRSSTAARARTPSGGRGADARRGCATVAYHAGMSPEARRATQEAFMERRARRWSWRRTRSGWASTRRTCERSPTGRCRRASRPTTRRRGGAGATGGRRARCCSPRAGTWAG